MNPDFVQLLGNTLPPRNDKTHTFANTVAVSKNGDIALLSESGSIHYSHLRSSGHPTELVRLDVLGITTNELVTMTTIEFDSDGRNILLWSESKVGIVELPQSLTAGSDLRRDEIETNCVFTSLWDANDEGVSNLVAKASFHQSCAHCVVILMRKDFLRLIDLRSLQSEILPLSTNRRFVSFSFGPAIEWMTHTLVLLTSGGEVYYLCPIIPNGAVLSLAAVEELWAWMDHIHHEKRDHYIYQDTYNAYLFNLFGPRPVISDEVYARSTFLRAGEFTSSPANSEESLLGLESKEQNSLCNFTPALRGPIAIRRDAATSELRDYAALSVGRHVFSEEGKHSHHDKESPTRDADGSSRRAATDIATLGSRIGPAFDLTPSAPVISIAYNTGDVEFFMLDYPQMRPLGVHVHSNSSFVGPSWRPVDQTRAALSCTSGSLLLAEAVTVRPAENSVVVDDTWRLTADPVLSHVLHATCVRLCESHLLSVVWLEKALEVQLEQHHGDNNSETESPTETNIVGSSPLTHPTRVLPVFVLPPGSALGDKRSGHQESKSAFSNSLSGHSSSAGSELSGAAVVHDAMLGHVALFRTSTGLASAVNLTVHTKICELQDTLQMHAGAPELLPLKEELDRATSSEQIRWKRSQLCIKKVAEGLRDMPQLDATTASALTSQPSSQNKKVLLETAQRLERDVLVPLNELAQTTLFSYELLRETYRSQVQVLEGSDDANSTSEPSSLSQGLKKMLASLNSEHGMMDERVRKIQEKFAAQRDKAEKYLAFAVSQRDKLTKAEGLYKKQLESWSRVVSQMNEQVAALRSLSGSLPSSEGFTGTSSPRAQPPLFSIVQSGVPGSAVKNPPVPNRAFRSPVPVSSETPRGASSSVLSPGFARYGHVGASEPSVGTPLAAGRVGADHRPYSTPSSVSSARGVEVGSASATPASAMFNRQFHTRHPPQVSPSPNFYSQYRSSRDAGYSAAGNATPSTTGASASAAGATARSTRTASHFASPGLRSPMTVGREARVVDPPVQLSQQDQDACTELLISQTDLLEKAQQELEQLESKLKTLRRDHST